MTLKSVRDDSGGFWLLRRSSRHSSAGQFPLQQKRLMNEGQISDESLGMLAKSKTLWIALLWRHIFYAIFPSTTSPVQENCQPDWMYDGSKFWWERDQKSPLCSTHQRGVKSEFQCVEMAIRRTLAIAHYMHIFKTALHLNQSNSKLQIPHLRWCSMEYHSCKKGGIREAILFSPLPSLAWKSDSQNEMLIERWSSSFVGLHVFSFLHPSNANALSSTSHLPV